MNYKVLIVDSMHDSIFEMLQELDLKVDYRPEIKRDKILDEISKYEGLIIRSKTKVDKEFLERASKLRFIARAGSGLDLVDLPIAEAKNIEVFNAPEGNRDAVAEHALGMLLSLFHNIKKADLEVRQQIWQREANRGLEIKGKTVSIIGYGNTGREFAKRLKGFDCKVLAYDKFKRYDSDEYSKAVQMEEVFEKTDILSLHIPLKEDTHYLVNEEYLNSFQKPIFFINTARGEIVDLAALQEALSSEKVLGACLDVLENEKLNKLTIEQKETFENLVQSNRVILTPHIAGWTHESYVRINEVLAQKIKQILPKLEPPEIATK